MLLMKKKIKNDSYSFFEFVKLTNSDNLKMSLAYYLNRNYSWFKQIIDKLRFK